MAVSSKEIEKIIARQSYIETAKVDLSFLKKGIVVVGSASVDGKEYNVGIEDGKATSCGCDDFYWRSKRNPGHVCRHMEAATLALALATEQAKEVKVAPVPTVAKTAKPARVRRSAVNTALVAEYNARYDEAVTAKVVARLDGVAMPQQCPVDAPVMPMAA